MKRRLAFAAILVLLAFLSAGTLRNQWRINDTNARVSTQALNGQHALNRQCSLFPISRKLYGDMLERRVITADDYGKVVSTAAAVCPDADIRP